MPRIPSALLAELSDALRESYLRASQLDQFLLTRLDRRFDDLTSRYIPLKEAVTEVVTRAHDQGWLRDLVQKAAEDRPQNDTFTRVLAALPDLAPASLPALGRSHIDRPSLLCGRALQWNEVCQMAPVRRHQVLLVPGGRGQDPMHFRDRIQVWLTPDPSRAMLTVHWPTPPKSLAEMLEALAASLGELGKTEADLRQVLQARLAYQNLVLLHPCITDGFDQPHFLEYYTAWLPAAVPERGTASLKCVQPIEWPVRARSGLIGRLFGGSGSSARTGALQFMAALKARQAAALRVLDVDELADLEPREIEQFLEDSEFTVEHQRILLSQLLGGPQVPGYLFKTIDDYWRSIGGQS